MTVKIDAVIQTIKPLIEQAREKNSGILTEQLIRDQVALFKDFPPFVETFKLYGIEMIVKELLQIYTTWIGEARSLADKDHKAWLPNKKSTIKWKYWDRYEEHLKREGWAEDVSKELDRITDHTLGLLEDPTRIDESNTWDRRGMVVGHVQSGKTANYTGLICKGIDAGYKVIIVLAGLHNSLRSQTQIRLDEGVLGYDSTKSLDPAARTPIGVGLNPSKPDYMVDSVTNRLEKGDFSKPKVNAFNIHLHKTMNPLLFVIKKNASVLKNLLEWIDSISTHSDEEGNKYISGIPLLVVDDEADHGSIDTNKMKLDPHGDLDPEHDPTTLNKRIRRLLQYFSQSAYVGYTATPFANIFIHQMAESRKYGEDLFPRSFITNLSAPSNYFGPVRVFGLEEDEDIGQEKIQGLPVIRTDAMEKDACAWLDFKHKKTSIPSYHGERKVPPSLMQAIHSFILVTAARRARKQFSKHNSMLIHVTRFNDVQEHIQNQVYAELEYVKDHIKRDTDTYRTRLSHQLKKLWEDDFIATTLAINDKECPVMEWQEIEPHLVHTVQSILVKTINGSTGDILEYENSKDTGLNIIAIGGDKLSRGLTLEGLSVSYFSRSSSSPMYDTLMQMGRWFGYRSGYYDLCRLYTTKDISEWFSHIASASEELRKEFDHMTAIGATPAEYGAKVRSHPVLLVTSRLKMRHGSKILISFSNYLAETRLLPFAENIIENNLSSAGQLYNRILSKAIETKKKGYLFAKVDSQEVIDFLDSYKEHPSDFVDTAKLSEYIKKQNKKSNLTEWTVYFPSGNGGNYSFVDTDFKLVKRQWGRGLFDEKNPEKNKSERLNANALVLNHLITEEHEFVDIDSVELQKVKTRHEAEKLTGSKASLASFVRNVRSPKQGLLIVYIIDHTYIEDKEISKPLVGLAISFPQIGNDVKVEYIVNSVFQEEEFSYE